MSQVQEKIRELIAAIKECEEYGRYQNAKQAIEKYPVLKQSADDFCRHKFELQESGADLFDEIDRLQQEYMEIGSNPVIWEYLTAENACCRILRQVNWQLLEQLDFGADFEK